MNKSLLIVLAAALGLYAWQRKTTAAKAEEVRTRPIEAVIVRAAPQVIAAPDLALPHADTFARSLPLPSASTALAQAEARAKAAEVANRALQEAAAEAFRKATATAPALASSPNAELAVLAGDIARQQYFSSPDGIAKGIAAGWISAEYEFEQKQRAQIEAAIKAGTYTGIPTGPFPMPAAGPPDVLIIQYGRENIRWDPDTGRWVTP